MSYTEIDCQALQTSYKHLLSTGVGSHDVKMSRIELLELFTL